MHGPINIRNTKCPACFPVSDSFPFVAGSSLHTLHIEYPTYLDQKDKVKNSQLLCALHRSSEAYIPFLGFVDCAYRYNRVKKNQLDAQLILCIFRQPLYVSDVSRAIIRRYNHMYTTIGTYYSF